MKTHASWENDYQKHIQTYGMDIHKNVNCISESNQLSLIELNYLQNQQTKIKQPKNLKENLNKCYKK